MRGAARRFAGRLAGWPTAALAFVAALAAILVWPVHPARAASASCPAPRASAAYTRSVRRALLSKRDLWGRQLLAAPSGPTYAAVRSRLAPLLYAYGNHGKPLTGSGVYYLPFSFPFSPYGPQGFALHVADGSQIVTRRAGGRSLTIYVGAGGRERYGSCLARLTPARLADGYLPILETAYVDAHGVRYTQESFVGRVYGTRSLVSFVHLGVDASQASAGAVVRLVPSQRLSPHGTDRLMAGAGTQLIFSDGGRYDGLAVRYDVPAGQSADVYAGWLNRPDDARALRLDPERYESAVEGVARFWQARLSRTTELVVPDERVMNAQRALLVQQLLLGWRYSVGNPYEELSFAEALDGADVLAGYGYDDMARAILRYTRERLAGKFTSWRTGELLLADSLYYRLYRDRRFLDRETPLVARSLAMLSERIAPRGGNGLLDPELFSSDIAREVYGLHGQTVALAGLRAMGRVWALTGHPELAARCRVLATRLQFGLERAVRASERRLPDGSLFVPAALLEKGKPFQRLSATRDGTYWNLVMPYALASGFFRPHGPEARGLLRYMLAHGSRLLGLVRADASRLYGRPVFPDSGTDQVYGLDVSRFLADNDQPDQLVLSLYGALGAGMTPDTFVSGEGATLAPLQGAYYRAMYLSPNGGANCAFLETLRLMLVHETRGPEGAPSGLELAFSTARPWLRSGKSIVVEHAPTSFGPVSYSIERDGPRVRVSVVVPDAPAPATLRLRLRLPRGDRLRWVRLRGHSLRFDPRSDTIDLSGRRGTLELVAAVS
jgi:hypothetical protein